MSEDFFSRISPTGLTWAILWSGQLFVRTEVSADTHMGAGWVEVTAPEDPDKIVHVSVGTHSVWVTSETHTVWFRRGVTSQVNYADYRVIGITWSLLENAYF